jgi:hypothetical protein
VSEYKKLIGETITRVIRDDETITFDFASGLQCRFYHDQDCCESVAIDSVDGGLEDLVGKPLTDVEEFIGDEFAPVGWKDGGSESHTWTAYRFAVDGAAMTVRWFGQSNGYYSESVNFAFIGGSSS